MIVKLFLESAFAPAVGAALLIFMFGSAPEPWRARIQSLIVAGGFAAGCYMLSGFPPWPPQSGAGSLIWVAFWMMLFPWAASPGSLVAYGLRGVWIIVGVTIAVWSQRHEILVSPVYSRNILALIFLGWGTWSIVERSSVKSHLVTPAVCATLSFTAASFLFLFQGSLLLCQMLTCMAAISGGLAVIAWLFPKRLSVHGVGVFWAAFLGIFLVTGFIFVEINPWLLIDMAIPFGVLFLKDMFLPKPKFAVVEALICAALSIVPLGYILWNVLQTSGPLF